jgi:hypothetical protein
MQAKSSVSDYPERGKLPWVAGHAVAVPKRKQSKLEVAGSKSQQTQLKPGLY